MEGNLRFKTDWASLIAGSEFTVFALFFFVFEGNFPSTSPRGAYIWRGDLTEGFLRYEFGGLIFGGDYFRNFTVSINILSDKLCFNFGAKIHQRQLQNWSFVYLRNFDIGKFTVNSL